MLTTGERGCRTAECAEPQVRTAEESQRYHPSHWRSSSTSPLFSSCQWLLTELLTLAVRGVVHQHLRPPGLWSWDLRVTGIDSKGSAFSYSQFPSEERNETSAGWKRKHRCPETRPRVDSSNTISLCGFMLWRYCCLWYSYPAPS